MPGKLSLILTLQLQKGLKELSNLDLRENPITEQDDYKKSVFDMFPQLEVLDGLDKEDNEVLSEEDEEDEYGDEENPSSPKKDAKVLNSDVNPNRKICMLSI